MPTQRLEESGGACRGGRERQREREKERTHTGEKQREKVLWLLLLCFFLHLGLPYANWAYPGVLFVLPEVFTLVCGPSLFLFSHRHFGLLFPILPNIPPSRDGRPNSLGIGASRSFWLLPAELGWRGVLGLPLLLVSRLRVLIEESI